MGGRERGVEPSTERGGRGWGFGGRGGVRERGEKEVVCVCGGER